MIRGREGRTMFGVKCKRGEGLDKEENEGGQRRS